MRPITYELAEELLARLLSPYADLPRDTLLKAVLWARFGNQTIGIGDGRCRVANVQGGAAIYPAQEWPLAPMLDRALQLELSL